MKARKWLVCLLALLMVFSLAACGSNSGAAEDALYDMEAPASAENGLSQSTSSSQTSALPSDRKLIRTVNIDAETEDLDTLLQDLDQRITALGGYAEAREIRNGGTYSQRRYRYASLTIRIPADQADSFVQHVGTQSNIVSSTESVEDVTLQYVDTESRVKALETERERLIALLEQAETLEDILKIEDRLTEVRYELEAYASQLRTLNNQVSYATIYLSITEVQEYTPVEEETVWQQISGGFMDSLKSIGNGVSELLIWLLAKSPYLVIWGAIGAAVLLVIRRSSKKRKTKKETPPEKTE